MIKLVVCIALLFAALVSARPGPNHGGGGPPGGGGGPPGGDNDNQWESALCANATLAQSFLTQVQQLITTLQTNGSFTQVLASSAQEVAYLQNSTDSALLSSNCTAYFAGLNNAIQADQQVLQTQQQYQQIADEQLFQIVNSLVGHSGYHHHG